MKTSRRFRRRQSRTLYIFVGCFSGFVDKVAAHKSFEGAQRAFSRYTGKRYQDVSEAISGCRGFTPAHVLGEKLDECKIFKVALMR